MRVLIILTFSAILAFGVGFWLTRSLIVSCIAACSAVLISTSIIWRVDFGTWNCFK